MSNRGGGRGGAPRGGGRGGGGGGRGGPLQYGPPPGGNVGNDGGRGRGSSPYSGDGGGRGRGAPPYSGDGGRGRGRGGAVSFSGATPASSSSAPPPLTSSSASPSTSTAVITDMEKLSIEQSQAPPAAAPPASTRSVRFPSRPGLGRLGQKCVVRANHFLVSLKENDLHHYDVSINPEVTSRGVNRAVMKELVVLFGSSHLGGKKPVYDGRKGFFTAGPLPFKSKDFVIKLGDKDEGSSGSTSLKREREFKVSIKFAAKTDLYQLQEFLAGKQRETPQETIQVLDIVLREKPSNQYTVVGRSFFSTKLGDKSEIGDGLECWRGYYQSLRPTQMGLSLNIDVAATSFYEAIPVVDFVKKLLNIRERDERRPISETDRAKIKRAIRGVRVEMTHLKVKKRNRISGITALPLNQLMFTVDDEGGKKISVADYFSEKYHKRLAFPHWPALQAGSDSRPIYLPMEVCKIVEGQRYSKKLNERQVTAILRAACQRPNDRQRNIEGMARQNEYQSDEFAKEFGITVDDRLTVIQGARVLQPPMLKYGDTGRDVRIQPRIGQWNMMNSKMVNGGRIDHWACVNFSRLADDSVNRFLYDLITMCIRVGMHVNTEPVFPIWSSRPDQIEKALVDLHNEAMKRLAASRGQLQLLIVILPDFTGKYGTIKRICETELGIVSQCCQPKQVFKNNNQYRENVSMKINVKVGGRNTVLMDAIHRKIPLLTDVPTIIFGADVTHPQPGEDTSPSIAAVVASMDWPEVTKYRCLVSAQKHRQEIIQDLYKVYQDPKKGTVHAGMIRELLFQFYKSTGQKPHRIIFYRDGVSEGQFSQVLLYELDAIRKACSSFEESYLPPVTFVVVQKRHHTRLFPVDSKMTDRSGNILPGTVVDTEICHPSEFDFYLCSHAGIQGTSRPTHYHVLWDENRFSADIMQMLTNSLCYTYARCTKSVSVVPPAYYAHLGAFRARYYIEGMEGSSESGPATRDRNAAVRPLPSIKENVKDVMFYC